MESNNAAPSPPADSVVAAAAQFSRYVRDALRAEPGLALQEITQPWTPEAMRAAIAAAGANDEAAARRELRKLRKRVMVRLAARDLAGLASLAEVTSTMTALAEVALDTAIGPIHADLVQLHGTPRGAESGGIQQIHVVGMGKLGGGELNVSSDIDLVYLYPEDGVTDGPRPISVHEFFTRLGRRLTGALSEITEDGYVFRVDVRLRPYGDSGPLAMSFEMLENYLVSQGREWERYAWIKGRVLNGDRSAELMELVRPFVFRRHLDFSAFASMRELHHQVRLEVARRDIADNIKLGPGGIREIEFIVQAFQLIRGGRDAELRRQPTLEVLSLLGERRLLPAEAVASLGAAYLFLRKLEHRLQYLDDQQTHALPQDPADRDRIAESMGHAHYAAFAAELDHHRQQVTRHFGEIFAAAPQAEEQRTSVWRKETVPGDAGEVTAQLTSLGYGQAAELQQRLAALRASSRYRQMSATSQARLDRLVPLAVDAAAAHPNPDATLERVLQLLESVSRRESYLALLEEYPQALARVAELMSASPWAAQYLTQYPILLDELLDNRSLHEAPDWSALGATLRRWLDEAGGDVEKQMDVLRHFKHAQTLHLLAQDLAGTLPLEALSDHLSDLACTILKEVLRLEWAGLRQRHRPEPAFAVIAYGKLGGKELGYASDLDLVFLYDDDAPEAPENYARLAQRVNHSVTSMTAAGVLYETDLRLRPDGASGLLVSPLSTFRDYQANHAWPWEHQALTRARFVAGDAAIGRAFESLRVELLCLARDPVKLRNEVIAMRQKMVDAHPNASGLFDLKHGRGGIIDVEFIVQYLVLGHAHAHPELTGNIGNLALLKLAARLKLIPESEAQGAHDAYRHFRQLQHSLRLQGERYARVPFPSVAQDALAVRRLWGRVFETGAPDDPAP